MARPSRFRHHPGVPGGDPRDPARDQCVCRARRGVSTPIRDRADGADSRHPQRNSGGEHDGRQPEPGELVPWCSSAVSANRHVPVADAWRRWPPIWRSGTGVRTAATLTLAGDGEVGLGPAGASGIPAPRRHRGGPQLVVEPEVAELLRPGPRAGAAVAQRGQPMASGDGDARGVVATGSADPR